MLMLRNKLTSMSFSEIITSENTNKLIKMFGEKGMGFTTGSECLTLLQTRVNT